MSRFTPAATKLMHDKREKFWNQFQREWEAKGWCPSDSGSPVAGINVIRNPRVNAMG